MSTNSSGLMRMASLIVLWLAPAASAQDVKAPSMESKAETIARLASPPQNLYGSTRVEYLREIQRFNPDAKEDIYWLVAHSPDKRVREDAVAWLGPLGTGTDVDRIIGIFGDLHGNLQDVKDFFFIVSCISSVEAMSFRGIDRATAVLDQMIEPDYWSRFDFTVDSPAVRASYFDSNTQFAIFALRSKAPTMDPDFPQKAQSALGKLKVEQQRTIYARYVESAMDVWRLQNESNGNLSEALRKRAEAKGIAPAEADSPPRKRFRSLLNLYQPRNRVDLTLEPEAKRRLAREAMAAFERISARMPEAKDDEFRTSWIMHLADNGIPLPLKSRPEALAKSIVESKFKEDLDVKTKKRLEQLRGLPIDPDGARINLFRTDPNDPGTEPSKEPLPADAAVNPQGAAEFISVAIPFQNPAEARAAIESSISPRAFNRLIASVDPDGAPMILMIWHAGEWYWNPFGW